MKAEMTITPDIGYIPKKSQMSPTVCFKNPQFQAAHFQQLLMRANAKASKEVFKTSPTNERQGNKEASINNPEQ